jgi:hypothetical protein
MFSKRLAFFSVVLIAVSQACVFSAKLPKSVSRGTNSATSKSLQPKPASPDTNFAGLNGLEGLKTSIESLRLKIKNIKDSVDTAISETKKRHAQQRNDVMVTGDSELLRAERKIEFINEVFAKSKEIKDEGAKSVFLTETEVKQYGPKWEFTIAIDYVEKTLTASEKQEDGSFIEDTFKYPLDHKELTQATQELQRIKREIQGKKAKLSRPQADELRELADVQNSIGVLDVNVVRIRKMLDVNSVNLGQIKQEIGNLDKKITDAELTTQNKLQRISKKYQTNNATKESDVNNMADKNNTVGQKKKNIKSKDGILVSRELLRKY